MNTFSFSLLSLSLLYLLPFPCITGQDLIHDTCKTCSKGDPNMKFGFCTTSLQAAPASHCASLQGLGTISIRLVSDNVTDTRCHVKQLLKKKKKKKMNPYMKACLEDCFQLYSDAIPSIKLAMKYYKAKRYGDANIEISSVMDAATTCEDGFKEKKGVVSPLTKRNENTFELSAMVLSIMQVVQTGLH